MSLAVIDAREWQNVFDLRSGEKRADDTPEVRIVRDVLAAHHYPGDVEDLSNRWVTDTALDLIERYQPQLACLCYAHQYFVSRYTPMGEAERRTLLLAAVDEAQRFVQASGYTPVIIGTGGKTPVLGELDLSRLEGLAISSHWSARYAGLHDATEKDLDYIRGLDHIERVVGRQEWIDLFPGAAHDPARIPEYLLIARPGWTFRTTGTPLRKALMIPATSLTIPVATPLGVPATILDIRGLIERHLPERRIALILVEGIGVEDFPLAHTPCVNNVGWYYYETGEAQYLTIMTGTHQVFAYPSGYKYHDENDNNPDYPYSGYFKQIPEHTLGSDFEGRSIAVGNRSMLTHMVFGADIAVECFARNLYNQGCMGVIHR